VKITYRNGLSNALTDSMEEAENVLCLGVGVTEPTGIFGTTQDAYRRFPQRVIECPLSENMLTGACVGLALEGYKPVLVHARMDFLMLTMEHLVNTAAKWGFMNGRYPNITVRAIVGRGWGQGPTHSQNPAALFAHIPGLRVYMPYRPSDAYFALRHAIATEGPVIVVEPRRLYNDEGTMPDPHDNYYWGLGNIWHPAGVHPDVTIVATSDTLQDAHDSIRALRAGGISAMVVDPQMFPLPGNLIEDAVTSTGRLVVVDNGWATAGLSSEIIARVCERVDLEVRPVRVTPPFMPTPASHPLEDTWYPSVDAIVRACAQVLGRDDLVTPVEPSIPAPAFKGPF